MKKIITISALLLSVVATTMNATKYEAESATLSDGAISVADAGASGGNYVDTQDLGVVTFTFDIPSAGWYNVLVATKNTDASEGRCQDFKLDSDPKFKIAIPLSQSFNTISIGGTQYFGVGSHTITITKNWGYVLLDYFTIEPTSVQNIQAEKANIGTGTIYNNELVSSEGRYLDTKNSDVTFDVTIPTTGIYRISIVGKNSTPELLTRVNDFNIDGGSALSLTMPSANYANYILADNYNLTAGAHTVNMVKSWGYFDLDFLSIEFLGTGTSINKGVAEKSSISITNKTVSVIAEGTYDLNIYEITGSEVSHISNATGLTTTQLSNSGIFIVEILTATGKETQKILVK